MNSSLFCFLQLPVTSSLLEPNIRLTPVFSDTITIGTSGGLWYKR